MLMELSRDLGCGDGEARVSLRAVSDQIGDQSGVEKLKIPRFLAWTKGFDGVPCARLGSRTKVWG